MNDWYSIIVKSRAKKLISSAQQGGLGFVDFIKEASRSGVSNDEDVQNYAALLREDQLRKRSAGKQQEITGAVGRSMQPRSTEEDLRKLRESMPQEKWVDTLVSDKEKYFGGSPRTEEQFYGAMGRQPLSSETTFSDVQENPAYNFAREQLPSQADELAAARLKVQQDAEARKAKQINEQQRLGDIRLRLQQNELEFKRYKLGVGVTESTLSRADDVEKIFQKTVQDMNDLEGQKKKLTKIISSKADEEGNPLNQEDIDNANAQLAEVETMLLKGDAQKKALAERVKTLTSEAYGKGAKAAKQSQKIFEEPGAGPTPTPTPVPGRAGTLSESVEQRRQRLGY